MTIRARFEGDPRPDKAVEIAAPIEPAQPVFADYWRHNKGTAPIGYQPVSVDPAFPARGDRSVRPADLGRVGRTDETVEGTVVLDVPARWDASPAEKRYRLEPGGHLAFPVTVSPTDAAPGRYFVAARIQDGGQDHEDVVAVDVGPGSMTRPPADTSSRSPSLVAAVEQALASQHRG